MSNYDDEFFQENLVNVNKTVLLILVYAIAVPFSFAIGNLFFIWYVPYSFCVAMLIYEIIAAAIMFFLSKFQRTQRIAQYFGVIAASGFVALMASRGVVRLSISYAFGTIISCLYYNRPLTIVTCIFDYFVSIGISYLQSFTNYNVVNGVYTQTVFMIQMVIGLTIEFLFLLFVTAAISRRTQKTMLRLTHSIDQRDTAYTQLQEKNATITKINDELEVTNQDLHQTQYKIIQFVAQCLGSHDLFTGRHVIHTQKYVELICKELIFEKLYTNKLNEQTIKLYSMAAFLHDIGKIHIPEGILNKPGKFTDEDYKIMKCHPEEGNNLLQFLPVIEEGNFNVIASQMAYCHHEKWDGTGYPRGLSGTDIPLAARIMAAADVLDALISQRLYKEPMSIDEAMDVFKKSSGTHFEPCIAQAVINCRDEIEAIDAQFKEAESDSNAEEVEWWNQYHQMINK